MHKSSDLNGKDHLPYPPLKISDIYQEIMPEEKDIRSEEDVKELEALKAHQRENMLRYTRKPLNRP